VRQYLCFELDWDVRLVLRRDEVPGIMLGRSVRLGWTTWLGRPRGASDPDPLTLHAEDLLARRAPAPAH
jgi:type VI secretion system protein ImpH